MSTHMQDTSSSPEAPTMDPDVPPVDEAETPAGAEQEAAAIDGPETSVSAAAAASGSGRKKQLEREGEIAADFLETLLDIADLDGDLEVDVDGDRAAVSIVDSEDGTVPRGLVGTDGEIVEALQELARLSVQAETGERSRLMLDVGGYRAGRRATVQAQAAEAIDQVNEDHLRRALAPMTAYERKVVHDEVLKAGLRSESEGEEPTRFVVVLPPS